MKFRITRKIDGKVLDTEDVTTAAFFGGDDDYTIERVRLVQGYILDEYPQCGQPRICIDHEPPGAKAGLFCTLGSCASA
jgi:hypothetical protein